MLVINTKLLIINFQLTVITNADSFFENEPNLQKQFSVRNVGPL